MKKEYLYAIIGLLGAVLLGIFISSSVVKSNNTQMMRMMGMGNFLSQNNQRSSDIIDAHFIEQMIPHHEDAITMAKHSLEKSSRPEVRELSQNIIDSQSKEIEQMKDWYRKWFGKEVPEDIQVMGMHGMNRQASIHMGMMGDDTDLTRLETAEDFDRAFVEEMIPHHQMAVMMANMLKNGTTKPEMKKLADDIIAAQNSEIDQMRGWLKAWQE